MSDLREAIEKAASDFVALEIAEGDFAALRRAQGDGAEALKAIGAKSAYRACAAQLRNILKRTENERPANESVNHAEPL